MIAKKELSAQQVVSYLMDFEDHFTSHKFNNLYWTGFEKFINDEDPSPECYRKVSKVVGTSNGHLDQAHQSDEEADAPEPLLPGTLSEDSELLDPSTELVDVTCEDELTLEFGPTGRVKLSANQISDYQNRGSLLEHVSVWEFITRVEKTSKAAAKRKHREALNNDEVDPDDELDILEEDMNKTVDVETYGTQGTPVPIDVDPVQSLEETPEEFDGDILSYYGRTRPKVELNILHIEASTHILRVCSPRLRRVPVPIGPALPRRDMPDLIQKYARLMLILFKPWRHACDLRDTGQTWEDAYLKFREDCSQSVLEAIDNI
jgi:hypothetical protein